MTQNRKREQTLERAQYGLEIIFVTYSTGSIFGDKEIASSSKKIYEVNT